MGRGENPHDADTGNDSLVCLASESLLTTSPSVCESGKIGEEDGEVSLGSFLCLPQVAMELSFTAAVPERQQVSNEWFAPRHQAVVTQIMLNFLHGEQHNFSMALSFPEITAHTFLLPVPHSNMQFWKSTFWCRPRALE